VWRPLSLDFLALSMKQIAVKLQYFTMNTLDLIFKNTLETVETASEAGV